MVAAAAAALMLIPAPAAHSEVRLPPLDKDPNRCERAVVGNTIGQVRVGAAAAQGQVPAAAAYVHRSCCLLLVGLGPLRPML